MADATVSPLGQKSPASGHLASPLSFISSAFAALLVALIRRVEPTWAEDLPLHHVAELIDAMIAYAEPGSAGWGTQSRSDTPMNNPSGSQPGRLRLLTAAKDVGCAVTASNTVDQIDIALRALHTKRDQCLIGR